jgi:excisionase family DNA binding protein
MFWWFAPEVKASRSQLASCSSWMIDVSREERHLLSRPFLTVKQVADLLSVGEVTVRHWIKDGELRAIDIGREWRIAPRDLEQFVEHRATRHSQQDVG